MLPAASVRPAGADYELWGYEVDRTRAPRNVPPVMDSQELAELLSASDQVIRTWAREGVIPSHRAPGARKFKFLRHEIFEWLVENRYRSGDDD